MSNHGEPWRKFVQTFFLAEQPNGYFVLNDIFRYLKEESVDDDASESADAVESTQPVVTADVPDQVAPVAQPPVAAPEPIFEQPREPTPAPPAPVVEPTPAPAPVDEEPANDVSEPIITQTPTPAPEQQPSAAATPAPIPAAQTNGIHTPEPEAAASAAPEPTPAPAPAPAAAAPAPTPTAAPAPKPSAPPAVAAPAPAPAAPAAPRSWASLAASNQKKWGSVAQDARVVTETVSSAPSSGAQTPVSQNQAPTQRSQGHHQQQRNEQGHPALIAAQSVTTAQCFVKVSERVLLVFHRIYNNPLLCSLRA